MWFVIVKHQSISVPVVVAGTAIAAVGEHRSLLSFAGLASTITPISSVTAGPVTVTVVLALSMCVTTPFVAVHVPERVADWFTTAWRATKTELPEVRTYGMFVRTAPSSASTTVWVVSVTPETFSIWKQ